jgi:hypothetical protein
VVHEESNDDLDELEVENGEDGVIGDLMIGKRSVKEEFHDKTPTTSLATIMGVKKIRSMRIKGNCKGR